MRKYQKYKKSNLLGIEDAPIQWTEKRMKHIAAKKRFAIVDGPFGTQLKADEYTESGVPLIRISDLNWGGTIETEELKYISEEKSQELLRSSITTDDIIIAKTGATIGKSVLNNKIEFGIIASSCLKIYPNKKEVEPWFLNYLISSKEAQELIILMSGGSTRDTINTQPLANIKFYWPSLPEQRAIFRFLDYKTGQIDSFIANRQKQIELLKEQKAGIINKAVTKGIIANAKMKDSGIDTLGIIPENWDVMELKFAAKMMRGKFSHRPRNDERLYGGKYPFIQTGDVTKTEKYITAYKQTLNDWGYSVSKMFPTGTVVITIAANIGDIAILNFDACFPDSIVGFYPKKNKTDYLFYLLKTMKEIFLSESIEGTQLNLSVDRLSSIKVAIPEPEEQQKIIDFINEETSTTETLISKYQKQIDLMQEYRTSLISQAVTGKIDVREWQPKKQQTA